MRQPSHGRLLEVREYEAVLSTLDDFTRHLLAIILRSPSDSQPSIAVTANFIARSFETLESLFVLYKRNDFHNCMVLLRSIIDRILHVAAIGSADAWQDFKIQSSIETHKYLNKIRSNMEIYNKSDPSFDNAYEESKKIVEELQARPKKGGKFTGLRPEAVSKEIGLKYVYDFGYDHASTYVHPMADEGIEAIARLLGIPAPVRGADNRTILQNACLSYLLLITNSIRYINNKLKDDLGDVTNNLIHFTGTGKPAYLAAAREIISKKLGAAYYNGRA